jgi:hypothetical protein
MVARCIESGFPGKTATAFIIAGPAAGAGLGAGAGLFWSGRTGASVAVIGLLIAL